MSADTAGALVDAVLAVGGFALVVLATAIALVIAGLGYWAGTAVALRYQARHLVRRIELYVRYPGCRAALDTNYQPRKEKP